MATVRYIEASRRRFTLEQLCARMREAYSLDDCHSIEGIDIRDVLQSIDSSQGSTTGSNSDPKSVITTE